MAHQFLGCYIRRSPAQNLKKKRKKEKKQLEQDNKHNIKENTLA